MAVDLRIEKFAVDTFRKLWVDIKIEKSVLPRPKDYGDMNENDVTEEVLCQVHSRIYLFGKTLTLSLNNDYNFYSKNGVAFYHYLCNHMTNYFAYPEMNIFDKMLMSCAVVCLMCAICSDSKNIIYRYTGPLSWAMYFEWGSKEEFYSAGGWAGLKKYTESCRVGFLEPERLLDIAILKQSDLECAKELFKLGENFYVWCDIIEVFKKRVSGNERVSCSSCLPLFDVFCFISNGGDPTVDDFKLIEGYIQLFLRSLPHERCVELSTNFLKGGIMTAEEEKVSIARIKADNTKLFLERIFPREHWDESDVPNAKCVFCGEDPEKPRASSTQSDDSGRVDHLKSTIRCTVSEVESTELSDFNQYEMTSDGRTSDEIEEKIVLRFFLALGIEPILSKVKANIEAEFGCQYSAQNTTNSTELLDIPKEKESSHQNITKKKKKKKKLPSKPID